MKATDLLKKGEVALVISTDGRDLEMDSKGFGQSGQWRMNPNHQVHKVIIYKRDKSRNTQEIYVAEHVGVTEADMPRRFVVSLANIRNVGTTTSTWHEFAEVKKGAQNPIRYVEG